MRATEPSERHFRLALLVLGHGVFIALLALAWKYALLRSTFGDTAFQLFQWVSQPGWDIEAHRYTAIVPQACVKFFALFVSDLRTLLVVSSLAHVLVGYGIYLLCAHVWKAPVAAFGCALAAVLCSRLTFYSPVLEANYLLCYPFLLIGYMEHRAARAFSPRTILVACALLLVPLIVHPMGWMVMLFCVVFMFVLGWSRGRVYVPLLALSASWPVLARWLFPPTGYELEQYEKIAGGLHRLDAIAQWGSTDFLVIHTFSASTTYLPAALVLIAALVGWGLLRRWWAALLTLGAAAGVLFSFLVTYHAGNAAIMQDRGVLPVATIIAFSASALMARLDRPSARVMVLTLATVVLFVKVRDVSFASRPFRNQFVATEEFIAMADRQGIARGIVDRVALEDRGVQITWALPVETLLRSAVRGPAQGRVLVCQDLLLPEGLPEQDLVPVLEFQLDAKANGNPYFQRADPPYVRLVQH